jgi:hypothetical protein
VNDAVPTEDEADIIVTNIGALVNKKERPLRLRETAQVR